MDVDGLRRDPGDQGRGLAGGEGVRFVDLEARPEVLVGEVVVDLEGECGDGVRGVGGGGDEGG